MSLRVLGPFELELQGPSRGAAKAVEALRDRGAAWRSASNAPARPGLYWMRGPSGLIGAWISLDARWLSDGPAAGEAPPLAGAVLEALVEAAWWRGLELPERSWRPLIVLEWPGPLAERSQVPPPGDARGGTVVPDLQERPPTLTDDLDDWEITSPEITGPYARPAAPSEVAPGDDEPEEGPGLVSVIGGWLRLERGVHRGSYRVMPAASMAGGVSGLEPEEWLLKLGAQDPTEGSAGLLVGLGGRRVFLLDGWLSRDLELHSGDREVYLPDRSVRHPWIGMAANAALTTASVLLGAWGLGLLAIRVATPAPTLTPPAPTVEPGPAISPCSAEHVPFVEEFRCQIERLSDPAWSGDGSAECLDKEGDQAPARPASSPGAELQTAYCGLRDRALDGWRGNFWSEDRRGNSPRLYDFGELAAAQACFNTLGYPDDYRQPGDAGLPWADPDRFLRDETFRYEPLLGVMEELDRHCEEARDQMEARVTGAVVATHIGGDEPGGEVNDVVTWYEENGEFREGIRALVRDVAVQLVGCFDAGWTDGVREPLLGRLCGPPPAASPEDPIWTSLGAGQSPGEAVERYARARFGQGSGARDLLWQCHLQLTGHAHNMPKPSVWVRWGLELPVPRHYAETGIGARSQLMLDAALSSFGEAGVEPGACWQLVRERLARYTPVHPLLGELEEESWLQPEQQLCAQVCAAGFGLYGQDSGGTWWTREADLGACLLTEPPPEDMARVSDADCGADGTGDGEHVCFPARIPWYKSWYYWFRPPKGRAAGEPKRYDEEPMPQSPSASDVCAFQLVAQDMLNVGKESLLGEDQAGAAWSGAHEKSPGVAGGRDGSAIARLLSMNVEYGPTPPQPQGVYGHEECADVATQCFASLMLDTTSRYINQRYAWVGGWEREVQALLTRDPKQIWIEDPWCAPIAPYLSQTELQDSPGDAACRIGVNEARERVGLALEAASRGQLGVVP